jgi:hypothetical protein
MVKIERRQKELRTIHPIVGSGISFAVGMDPAPTVGTLIMKSIQIFIFPPFRAVFFIHDKLIVKRLF